MELRTAIARASNDKKAGWVKLEVALAQSCLQRTLFRCVYLSGRC